MSDVLKIALLGGHNGAGRTAHTVASRKQPSRSKGRLWKRSEKALRKTRRERPLPLRP
jgi:hypothetical protein